MERKGGGEGGTGRRETKGEEKKEILKQVKHIVLQQVLQFTLRIGSLCIPNSIKL